MQLTTTPANLGTSLRYKSYVAMKCVAIHSYGYGDYRQSWESYLIKGIIGVATYLKVGGQNQVEKQCLL